MIIKGNLTDWGSKTKCNLKSQSEISNFIEEYIMLANEVLKF